MSRIWVFRHAESLSSTGAKTLEPAGIPLSEHGRVQAKELAAALREPPQRIIASPFRRALDTAAPIAEKFPAVDFEVWPIQEFTYLEPATCVGTSWVERKPRIDAYWAGLDPHYVDGEGAESFAQLLARARAFLKQAARVGCELAIAISHGQFMQATKLLAEAPDLEDRNAMSIFVDREITRPFANCERMDLVVRHGRISALASSSNTKGRTG
jgi:2,3-bisphosphoglycerate-dependent phosphoglycerate mutase